MKQLRYIALAVVVALGLGAQAQAPQGYYSSLAGKKDGELKTAIWQMIRNFTQVSSYNDLPKYFQKTDVYPESTRWWDMYSDIPLYAPSFKGLNREHSFPKSWWGGLTDIPAYVDLNHLYPSEAAANMAKSNYPLGTVDRNSKVAFDNGITTVGYPVTGQGGGAGSVFEPADEYKGDFARTYFYMATCYQNLTWKYTYMVSQNLFPTLNGWSQTLLMKWHREDPVSDKEVMRNNAVYAIQNNRNPFIDQPELAEYLWGNKVGQPYVVGQGGEPAGDPELTTPTQGMSLDLGQVALGRSVTGKLFFHGQYLTGALDLVVTGTDKKQFSLGTASINADLVNADNGYWLNVTYTPTALGQHTAKLIVSEGGLVGSRGIELRGECLEAPTLSAPTALAPTDITSDTYTANWQPVESDVVDYYVVTRTRYVGGAAMTEELVAEENYLEIDGFNGSDSESYAVQSVRLGYRSPMSNVVFVEHAGITGVEYAQPLTLLPLDGCIRLQMSAPQTGLRVFDTAGRLLQYIPVVQHNDELQLPAGVYLIVTDQHPAPLKAAVD